jgi:hypothetical protein
VPADAKNPMLWTGRPDALAISVGGQDQPKISTEQKRVKDVPISAAALLARANLRPRQPHRYRVLPGGCCACLAPPGAQAAPARGAFRGARCAPAAEPAAPSIGQ